MATYGDIRTWTEAPVDASVTATNNAVNTLIGMSDELATAGAPTDWHGDAADAARTTRTALGDRMEHTVAEVAAVRGALADAADGVIAVRVAVEETEAAARANQFTVNPDGSVTDTATDTTDRVERARLHADLTDQVTRVLRLADTIDNALASILDKATSATISDEGATDLTAAAAAGNRQGSLHESLLAKYQVSVDPRGMTTYPDGVTGWLLKQAGFQPQRMTVGEAELLDDIGPAGLKDAYDIYKTALNDSAGPFGGAGVTDGHTDAFRHAYWNAMLANRFGQDWTERYTTAHERVDTNAASAEAMDLHNNEVGRRIAAQHPDAGPAELRGYIERAVRDGEMVVVGPDGRLVRSNEVEIGGTGRANDPPGVGGPDPRGPKPYEDNSSGGYNPGSDGDNYGTYDN